MNARHLDWVWMKRNMVCNSLRTIYIAFLNDTNTEISITLIKSIHMGKKGDI